MQNVKRTRKGIAAVALTVVFLFSTVGCGILPVEEAVIEPKITQKKADVDYYTEEVKKDNIDNRFSVIGDFVTMENKEYSFTFKGGVLKSIYVKPGDTVKPGMVLAELENNLDIQIQQQELILRKAEIAYSQTKGMPKADPYSVKLAGIDVESARIQLNSMKLERDKSRIICSNTGVVDFVENFKAGDFVEIHKTLVRVVNNKKIVLVYKGEDARQFKKSMAVNVSLDGKTYNARIIQEGEKRVKFQVDQLTLREDLIGTYANINIITRQKKGVLVLNKSFIHEYNGQKFVKVLENEIQTERFVKLGLVNESMVEIVSGLKAGEKVIR
jgi:multidrug efflux pump subunit AcrA (membrane-fusion protein)